MKGIREGIIKIRLMESSGHRMVITAIGIGTKMMEAKSRVIDKN